MEENRWIFFLFIPSLKKNSGKAIVPKAACSGDKMSEKIKEPVGIKVRLGAYWGFPSGSEIR